MPQNDRNQNGHELSIIVNKLDNIENTLFDEVDKKLESFKTEIKTIIEATIQLVNENINRIDSSVKEELAKQNTFIQKHEIEINQNEKDIEGLEKSLEVVSKRLDKVENNQDSFIKKNSFKWIIILSIIYFIINISIPIIDRLTDDRRLVVKEVSSETTSSENHTE